MALSSGQRFEQCVLGGVDPFVEPRQGGLAGLGQRDHVAAAVPLVADPGHQPVTLELGQQCVHVAAVDRQPSS